MNSDYRGRPGLGVIELDIDTATGTVRTDPNGFAIMAHCGKLNEMQTLPGAVSVISGEPAVIYATSQVTLPLTPSELRRLALRSLRPTEFKALFAAAGMFHEIHDDFYELDSGEAMQPFENEADDARHG